MAQVRPALPAAAPFLPDDDRFNENFVSFVKDIRTELKDVREIEVSMDFILNIVKLAAIDPNNKFLIKQQLVPAEVERLKNTVTEKIIGMSEISRNIIKMQMNIREKWRTREQVISSFREGIDRKVLPLMAEMRKGIPKQYNHYELYYGKLIGATLYYANMGPDTELAVIHETRDVLEKIFYKDDINLLTTMSPEDRETELMRIISIAVGVRLYNKDNSPCKQQEGQPELYEDLTITLPKKLRDGLEQLKSMRALNTERLIKYTTAIQKYFLKHFVIRAGRREISLGMVKARQGLVMVHQLLIYTKNITDELEHEEKHVQLLYNSYQSVLPELAQDLKKTNCPHTLVYPKYIALCECWQDLLDANVFTNALLSLSLDVMKLSESELLTMDEFINDFISALNMRVPSEEEFFTFPPGRVQLDANTHGLRKIECRGDVDPFRMNFSGFCVNSLVRGAGMPVLTNPNLGIFTWKNMNFMFSSVEAATEFAKNPAVVVRRAIGIARRWPELIILLNVENEAYDTNAQNETDGYRRFFSGLLVSKSSGVQCETHPIPNNIVDSYTWNEWELRRRGIILSKIHTRRTHSTQTHWQALKKNVESQTYGQVSQLVQTNTNVHTSIPNSKFYFAGLRGLHCGMSPHIVELTSETPDDLQCVCMPAVQEEVALIPECDEGHRRRRKSLGLRF